MRAALERPSKLEAWFRLNKDPDLDADSSTLARQLRYFEVPQYFTWDTSSSSWKRRRRRARGGNVIGRMTNIKPSAGEQFYLRLLLLHVPGACATCWSDLQAPSGSADGSKTFQAKARLLGLLHDDRETADMLTEAVRLIRSLNKLAELFCETLVWLEVHDKPRLWDTFLTLLREQHPSISIGNFYISVQKHLNEYALSLTECGISPPEGETTINSACRAEDEYLRELRSPDELQKERAACDALTLTDEQSFIYTSMLCSIDRTGDSTDHTVHYVDGPAGAGKTHLYRKLLHYVRSTGRIALAVAMSGIAALLLPGGRTAHSRFRLPVPVPLEGCKCNIKSQSVAARVLRDAAVLIWDEAPTAPKSVFQAVDFLLQDLRQDTRPFGGLPILLGGDFRQIPPVMKFLDRDAIAAHTLIALPWWREDKVSRFTLSENMRAKQDLSYANFCMDLGNGLLQAPDGSQLKSG